MTSEIEKHKHILCAMIDDAEKIKTDACCSSVDGNKIRTIVESALVITTLQNPYNEEKLNNKQCLNIYNNYVASIIKNQELPLTTRASIASHLPSTTYENMQLKRVVRHEILKTKSSPSVLYELLTTLDGPR